MELENEIKKISKLEGIDEEVIYRRFRKGRVVILGNYVREIEPIGIGEGLRVKINANIGTSPDYISIEEELEKARVAIKYGAHTLMDLSTGGDLDEIRRAILKIGVPIGTVPIYQAGVEAARKKGKIVDMSEDEILGTIEKQAKDGVDFMTLHVGITRESLGKLERQKRITGIVSRGGSFIACWMLYNDQENPLYKNFDYILEIAKEYNVTLSLGDALRPGSIPDSTDRAQIQELIILGELVDKCREVGVQCMVEGPGHMKINEIRANVVIQKKLCRGAPFYVLGPLVTDIAPGYDHIAGAIRGAIAAYAGADFLCYVTPAEHLALPTVEDVKLGVIASRIAAHAADIARGIDEELDIEMSRARAKFDWEKQFELCIDREKAERYRASRKPADKDVCTMCGSFCAIKLIKSYLKENEADSKGS